MDDTNSNSVPSLPKELEKITLASARFCRVSSPLEHLVGENPVKRHSLIATSRGYLIELKEGEILRYHRVEWKDVKKVLVHHEFQPPQLFIVLLRQNHQAYLIAYSNFKILNEWEDIEDVNSEDLDDVGLPSLELKHSSGDVTVISSSVLSAMSHPIRGSQAPPERAKQDAASALAHRLKGGIKHAEQLNSQKRMKETFIIQKLGTLQSQLQGHKAIDEDNLTVALTVEDDDDDELSDVQQCLPLASTPNVSLDIVSVRHKIVHDKWVIGVNVVNKSDRKLVCNIQLMLHVSKGTNKLSYTTKILKIIQRRSQMNSVSSQVEQSGTKKKSSSESKVSVESLDPPILRPKKKACVLGVCEIPDFTDSSTVECSGIVTYTCRTLNPESTQQLLPVKSSSQQYQVSFEPVVLAAKDLHSHYVDVEKNLPQAGVPFSTVSLVGGSVHNAITLTSLVSPFYDLITRLSRKHELVKVPGVTGMYCFYPEKCHPLRFASLTLHMVDSNRGDLELFTRDNSQAIILVYTILAELPSDIIVQPSQSSNIIQEAEDENTRQQLLAKMKEAVTYVMDGYETQATFGKVDSGSPSKVSRSLKNNGARNGPEFSREVYENERDSFFARKEDVTFNASSYSEWRKKLFEIQSEMDALYVKYLK